MPLCDNDDGDINSYVFYFYNLTIRPTPFSIRAPGLRITFDFKGPVPPRDLGYISVYREEGTYPLRYSKTWLIWKGSLERLDPWPDFQLSFEIS